MFIEREQRGQRGRTEGASGSSLINGEQTFLVKHRQPTSLSFFKRRRNLKRSSRDMFFRSGASWRLKDSSRALKMAETSILPAPPPPLYGFPN